MSVIEMRFFSECLNMFTNANIILPLPRDAKAKIDALPVLYLLHGMGDDATAWLRKTSVERYALSRGTAVIMPDGALSCYENMAHGARYRDYICRELPKLMQENFPLSTQREKNYIAGFDCFFDAAFYSLFKVSAVFCACYHACQVKADNAFAF